MFLTRKATCSLKIQFLTMGQDVERISAERRFFVVVVLVQSCRDVSAEFLKNTELRSLPGRNFILKESHNDLRTSTHPG